MKTQKNQTRAIDRILIKDQADAVTNGVYDRCVVSSRSVDVVQRMWNGLVPAPRWSAPALIETQKHVALWHSARYGSDRLEVSIAFPGLEGAGRAKSERRRETRKARL